MSTRERWQCLCTQLAAASCPDAALHPLADSLFTELESLYANPPRAYHSLEHIQDCLRVLGLRHAEANNAALVEWSVWLHDCIYVSTRSDNEQRSAEVSTAMLNHLGVAPAFAVDVQSIILATRHTGDSLTGDAALVADIDLSILASDRSRYARYADAIRAEYSFASDADYQRGRRAFLTKMLERPHLFHLTTSQRTYESAARANLAWEINRLTHGSPGSPENFGTPIS
jgi:predicted metal-dependent HD superfamily phosphohydrolase